MVRFRMNTTRMTSAFGASAAFGLVLGAAALFCPAPAHAADDDVSADQKFLRSIMEGLGFRRDGEETINYQERSPFVTAARTEGRRDRQQPGLAERPRRRTAQDASGDGERSQHQRRTRARTESAAPRSADAGRQAEEKPGAHRRRLRGAGIRLR